MRTQYIIASVWGLTACGGGAPTDPPSNQQGIGMEDKPASTAIAIPAGSGMADPPTPTSSGSGVASSGQSDPEAGAPSPIIINGSGVADPPSSGSASGSSESGSTGNGSSGMSQSSGAESGSMLDAAPACDNGSLAGVGMGNFTISFDLSDKDGSAQAVVNQRMANCIDNDPYWSIRLNDPACGQGYLSLEHYLNTLSVQCINAGSGSYQVVIHRSNGQITMTINTATGMHVPGSQPIVWADATNWDMVAPVSSGTEVCDTMVKPLDGTLTNLCVEKE